MGLDEDATDFAEPSSIRQRAGHAEHILANGLLANDRSQYVLAALEYQSVLTDPCLGPGDPYHAHIQSSLGAVFCLIAQNEPAGPRRLDFLDRARALLSKSLERCLKAATPLAWARDRANLSIVHLTRYEQTRTPAELLTALMSMEGVADAFAHAGDSQSAGWANTISKHLDALKNQRH